MKGPFVPGTQWPSPAPLTAPTGSGLGWLSQAPKADRRPGVVGTGWPAPSAGPGHLAGRGQGGGQGIDVSVCPADTSTCLLPARQAHTVVPRVW